MMAAMVSRWSRTVFEECFKWSHQRLVFGKPLYVPLPIPLSLTTH